MEKDDLSYYSPTELKEVFTNWGNWLSLNDPELAQKIVKDIVQAEFPDMEFETQRTI